uniref:Histone acetyltransferase KAT6 n=1 Tax=Phallusia mammillata TaxID=59560 RepID=A0A6F9DG63_9ASCI|nr:Histone acetyltransferase KAT6 [Phallusia mammillata]
MVHSKKCSLKRPAFSSSSAESTAKKSKDQPQMNVKEGIAESNIAQEIRPVICDFCLGEESRNRDGVFEKMLFCVDCAAKAHPSCMKYSKSLAKKALTYSWQCIECKTCAVCASAEDGDSILLCDACDKAYHMSCHYPKVKDNPDGNWVCESCLEDTLHAPHSPAEFKATTSENHQHSKHKGFNGETPGGQKNGSAFTNGLADEVLLKDSNFVQWTSTEVASYFGSLGFSKHASVFIKEEIDGRALLLLRRTDVISGLSLKLGPAVKIYKHILNLQSKNSPLNLMNGTS